MFETRNKSHGSGAHKGDQEQSPTPNVSWENSTAACKSALVSRSMFLNSDTPLLPVCNYFETKKKLQKQLSNLTERALLSDSPHLI